LHDVSLCTQRGWRIQTANHGKGGGKEPCRVKLPRA
jgi:hypothetical protein